MSGRLKKMLSYLVGLFLATDGFLGVLDAYFAQSFSIYATTVIALEIVGGMIFLILGSRYERRRSVTLKLLSFAWNAGHRSKQRKVQENTPNSLQ